MKATNHVNSEFSSIMLTIYVNVCRPQDEGLLEWWRNVEGMVKVKASLL